MKYFYCLIFPLILSCSPEQKKELIHYDNPANLTIPIPSTPSPDKQVYSAIFNGLTSYTVKDSTTVQNWFVLEYPMVGTEPKIEVSNDLRYSILKDSGASISIRISHLGKIYETKETENLKVNDDKIFSFTETIPCDSLGNQKYYFTLTIRNNKKRLFTRVDFDTWDSKLIRK